MIDAFHNNDIPITQQEALEIFQANVEFAKQVAELQQTWYKINTVVEQHEKKMAGLSNISPGNNENVDTVQNIQSNQSSNIQNNLNILNEKQEASS